jgi:hypothetical protein
VARNEDVKWVNNPCLQLSYYVLVTKYYSGDQIKKNEVGGVYSTYGGGERCIQDFGGET